MSDCSGENSCGEGVCPSCQEELAEYDLSEVPVEALAAEIIKRHTSAVVCGYIEDGDSAKCFSRSSGHRYGILGLIDYVKHQLVEEMEAETQQARMGRAMQEIGERLGIFNEGSGESEEEDAESDG